MEGEKKERVILIVEDNPLNMELVCDWLRSHQYTVVEATDAMECRERLKNGVRPDLILMDLQLPEVDGYTLVREIRSRLDGKDTPVVALTAFALKEEREKAMEAGCTGVITKPIQINSFLKDIERYLKQD